MSQTEVYVIGGGASGLVAAIVAKRNGAKVTILERNHRIGKKILATGNGRCNYTNVLANPTDYNNPDFVKEALTYFPPARAITFFEQLGIVPKVEKEGKAYPLSEQASSIVDVLLYEINRLKIKVIANAFVNNINYSNQKFNIYLENGQHFVTDNVIIATGGRAMPKSGSDGNGYDLARALGHTVTNTFPSIVKLKLDSPYLRHLEGIKMPTQVDLMLEDKVIQSEYNDIIFGNYGISGPAILDISRKALEIWHSGKTPQVRLQLVTTLSRQDIVERFQSAEYKPIDVSLIGLIHKRYISAIIKEAGIEKQNTLVKDLSKAKLNRLIDLLFDWRFNITGSKSFHDAQATAGGVSLQEIDSATMESTIVPNLYFCGEVMDIDGRCGGFNLQWAWASGTIAGEQAARSEKNDQN